MKGKIIVTSVAITFLLIMGGAYYLFIWDGSPMAKNEAPEPQIGANVNKVNAKQPIEFTADGSKDRDGSIVFYKWDFGDGTTANGKTVTHTYETGGKYTVTLTVIDDDGSPSSKSMDVVVNSLPVADFNISVEKGHVGEVVTFDASSSSDPDGAVSSYTWNFGDGGSADGVKVSHKYTTLGSFPVTLTVTDNDGASSNITKTFSVVERTFNIEWEKSEETLATRSNTTLETETSTETINVEKKNMASITFTLTWSDTLPIPAPFHLRKNDPDTFNLSVSMGIYHGNASGNSEKLVVTFDLSDAPNNTTLTAVDKDTAEEYAAASFESTAGVGVWTALITAVNCGDGLLFNGGIFPDNSNSWDLEVSCQYYVPHAEEIQG